MRVVCISLSTCYQVPDDDDVDGDGGDIDDGFLKYVCMIPLFDGVRLLNNITFRDIE